MGTLIGEEIMSFGGSGGALQEERQQVEQEQAILNEKKKKLEERRIADLRAQFTSGGLDAPGASATSPATLGGAVAPVGLVPVAPPTRRI